MVTKRSKKDILSGIGNIAIDLLLFVMWAVFAAIHASKGESMKMVAALFACGCFLLFIVGKGIIFNFMHEIKHLNAKLDLLARQAGLNPSSLDDASAQKAYADLLSVEEDNADEPRD